MFRWLARILEAGVDLLEVKAQLTLRSLEQVGIALVVYLAASLLLIVSVGILLAAAVVALVPVVGTALALVIVGLGAAAIGGVAILIVNHRGDVKDKSGRSLEDEAEERKEVFQKALRGESSDESEAKGEQISIGEKLLCAALKNPAAIASAAFAVVSLLGIRRTTRLIGTGTALFGLVESLKLNQPASRSAGSERSARESMAPSSDDRARSVPARRAEPRNGQWQHDRDAAPLRP